MCFRREGRIKQSPNLGVGLNKSEPFSSPGMFPLETLEVVVRSDTQTAEVSVGYYPSRLIFPKKPALLAR